MKIFGVALLVVGFAWITLDAAVVFTAFQHSRWIWQSKNLPPGVTVTRSEASGAMREISLALKDRHRVVVFPALTMLAGGLIAAFSGQKHGDK